MPREHEKTPKDPAEPKPRRRKPPPGRARLVFHVLADRTVVFAVRPDGKVVGHVLPRGRTELAAEVARLRRKMGVASAARGLVVRTAGAARDVDAEAEAEPGGDAAPLLRSLYRDLVAPVERALPEGAPLVVEPHGPLWMLPFAALLDGKDRWLADRHPLIHAPSEDVLRELERDIDVARPGELRALIVGDPVMPKVPPKGDVELELGPLPGAREEAAEIAALFPGRSTLLLGADASWSRVEQEMPRHGILHFATHGIAWPDDPLGSFLALAAPPEGDSLLTARRILDATLRSPVLREIAPELAEDFDSNPPITDLVVLSACQTALGQVTGDGVIGLTRAFLIAGARSVAVSLWSVDDDATGALMAELYRGYLEQDDKAVALQRAMQHVRSTSEWAAPRFWAPFVLVGAAR